MGVLEVCRKVFQEIRTTQSKASAVPAMGVPHPCDLPHLLLQGYIIQKVQSQPTLNGPVEVTR